MNFRATGETSMTPQVGRAETRDWTDSTGSTEEVPDLLGGRFRLLGKIGDGPRATVFNVHDERVPAERFAVKYFQAALVEAEALRAFRHEQTLVGRIPQVGTSLDIGTTAEGRLYVVSEWVHGYSIVEYSDQQKLTLSDRLGLLSEVCRCVQQAHQFGVIHRAIKPTNVLISAGDRPRLSVLDFGHSSIVPERCLDREKTDDLAECGRAIAYMSPEYAAGQQIDRDTRSDIYSLGAVLYELVTGAPPFGMRQLARLEPAERRRMIREQVPPKPSVCIRRQGEAGLNAWAQNRGGEPRALLRQVAERIDDVVMRCLEKDRTRRFESAIELSRALENLRNGSDGPERSTTGLSDWWRGIWARGHDEAAARSA